jgi:hypothetical protein
MEQIRAYLISIQIQPEIAQSLALALVEQRVGSVDELLSLAENDLRDPRIGMSIGDLSRIRPYLKSYAAQRNSVGKSLLYITLFSHSS